MKGLLYRLWRLPLAHAVFLALPLQIVMVWVAHEGWVQYVRNRDYRYAPDLTPPFDLDQWRYFARMELRRSVSRALMPDMPLGDRLETISLTIDREHMHSLNADLPTSGRTTYYPALLELDGERRRRHQVKVRYMGDNHWHWLYPQKSWRIRSRNGRPIRDRRAFNLKNPPLTVNVEDVLANQIANEIGLLAPEVRPVKLLVNGVFTGVYLWWDLADESLLRRERRMPGSIYSGDGAMPDEHGVANVFRAERSWEKVASRNAEQQLDRSDIRALIAAINDADAPAFHRFARHHLSIPQFASFVAIDRLFGGMHHDYCHNHKLYFDPYKGRFEPIEWDFAYWRLAKRPAAFDQALNPLLSRIRQHPELELAIQRALHALVERLTPTVVQQRIDAAVADMRPALEADGFRDVRHHLGSVPLRLRNVHCAFFTDRELERAVAHLRDGYADRHAWLRERLADSSLSVRIRDLGDDAHSLTLESAGLVGQVWSSLAVRTDAARVELLRDRNRNGVLDDGDETVATAAARDGVARLELAETLLPGLVETPLHSPLPRLWGYVDFEPAPLRYRYVVRHVGGDLRDPRLRAHNAVTDEEVAVRPADAATNHRSRDAATDATAVFSFHPWNLPPAPAPRRVALGPGDVVVERTRVFESTATVVFAPGTTVRLAAGASLLFHGRVLAEGTPDRPVRFVPAVDEQPWGVFSLHGAGTAGSRLRHCRFHGGSTDTAHMVLRTGMISVLDTEDIVMEACDVGRNHVGDDALHWGYVTGGVISDCTFHDARADAVDLDICRDVQVVGCRFRDSVNDGLDLMTCDVRVVDCEFHDAGDKGISVGEATRLQVSGSRFERCATGLEVKDNSVASVDPATVFRDCASGVRLYRKNPRYSSGGTIRATQLNVYGSPDPLTADRRSTVEVGVLLTEPARE